MIISVFTLLNGVGISFLACRGVGKTVTEDSRRTAEHRLPKLVGDVHNDAWSHKRALYGDFHSTTKSR